MAEKIRHVDDESLEQYSSGTLPGEKVAEVEQHLLICGPCQGRLARIDVWLGSVELAARRLREESRQDQSRPAMRAGRH